LANVAWLADRGVPSVHSNPGRLLPYHRSGTGNRSRRGPARDPRAERAGVLDLPRVFSVSSLTNHRPFHRGGCGVEVSVDPCGIDLDRPQQSGLRHPGEALRARYGQGGVGGSDGQEAASMSARSCGDRAARYRTPAMAADAEWRSKARHFLARSPGHETAAGGDWLNGHSGP